MAGFSMRSFLWIYGIALSILSAWLIAAESFDVGSVKLPDSQVTAVDLAKARDKTLWAAQIGLVRGDLWTKLAYTDAYLVWNKSADLRKINQAKQNLERSVKLMPANPGAWLLLADLAAIYGWNSPKAEASLVMSYYTGAHEQSLVPLRLAVASRLDVTSDPELGRLFKQEIDDILIYETGLKSAVAQAYVTATPHAREVIMNAAKDLAPDFAKTLLTH
jgi:hypothetical protein